MMKWALRDQWHMTLVTQSRLKEAIGSDAKGYASLAMYAAAIPLAFVNRPCAAMIVLTRIV